MGVRPNASPFSRTELGAVEFDIWKVRGPGHGTFRSYPGEPVAVGPAYWCGPPGWKPCGACAATGGKAVRIPRRRGHAVDALAPVGYIGATKSAATGRWARCTGEVDVALRRSDGIQRPNGGGACVSGGVVHVPVVPGSAPARHAYDAGHAPIRAGAEIAVKRSGLYRRSSILCSRWHPNRLQEWERGAVLYMRPGWLYSTSVSAMSPETFLRGCSAALEEAQVADRCKPTLRVTVDAMHNS